MIIRPDAGALLFITQPDHARLAADLLEHWPEAGRHPRYDAIALAAREHDNGWRELDADMVFDHESGRALDFVDAPELVKQSVWPRGVDRLGETAPYAAALVARHAIFVYDAHRGRASWPSFFDRMAARRDALLQRAGVSADDLDADYRYLCVADLLSLTFCNGWGDDHERLGVRARCVDGVLTIAPPILGPESVPLRVRARRLENRRYASAADLRTAFEDAPLELLQGRTATA
jgi:hypothetical protein